MEEEGGAGGVNRDFHLIWMTDEKVTIATATAKC